MSDVVRCRCCGIQVYGTRAQVRVCPICDKCDGLHGDKLQETVTKLVGSGQMDPGLALCRSLIDDAQLAGAIVFVDAGPGVGHIIDIPRPPARWETVIARATCRGDLPEMFAVVDAILKRYIPGKCTRATLDAIQGDLLQALACLDPSVLTVTVNSERDMLDPEHLIIQVQTTTPAMGAVIGKGAEDVVIPDDIMLRARGQA